MKDIGFTAFELISAHMHNSFCYVIIFIDFYQKIVYNQWLLYNKNRKAIREEKQEAVLFYGSFAAFVR